MDDWKLSIDSPDLATCSNSIPKDAATPTAFVISSRLPPNWALICPVTLPAFSKISLKGIIAPVWTWIEFIIPKELLYCSSMDLPTTRDDCAKFAVALSDKPNFSDKTVASFVISVEKLAAIPN